MIHLEHINLVVEDIDAMLAFYQAAFPHWRVRGGGKGQWYGKPRNWLHFGDDYQYIAMSDHGSGGHRDLSGSTVGLAHFAYVVDDIEGVTQRLLDAGFEIAQSGGDDPYRKNIYFIDPAGFEVEFVEYLTDVPALRNRY